MMSSESACGLVSPSQFLYAPNQDHLLLELAVLVEFWADLPVKAERESRDELGTRVQFEKSTVNIL
jgi:hypothetical protein